MFKRVFVIDDSVVARLTLKKVLSEFEFDIREANGGRIACEMMETLPADQFPELIFLDITMPDWDGFETLQEIRKRWPALPVIMVTADVQKQTTEMVLKLGAQAVVAKPADRSAILKAIALVPGSGVGSEVR